MMRNKFLITYDLRKPGQDYADLYDEIKKLGDVQHPLESVWVVKVADFSIAANDIYLRIRPKIDDGDYLFIVQIKDSDFNGWLPKNFWTWIKTD